MSATGRSEVRLPNDQYATPSWVTRAIVPELDRSDRARCETRVLEPACGIGSLTRELVKQGYDRSRITGVEIDPGLAFEHERCGYYTKIADFLILSQTMHALGARFDLIVTNPPYALAAEYVRACLPLVARGGHLALLLRLNFLGGQKRVALHREHPCDAYVLPRRPSFTGHGTDATEYAWFIWGPGRGNRWFLLNTESNGA